MGVDNALITRELRKLFSQELGWAPKELHEKGTVLQLEVGSPTGMRPHVAKDNLKFLDEDFTEATGIEVSTPWDKEGADVLLIHSAGDIISFPESVDRLYHFMQCRRHQLDALIGSAGIRRRQLRPVL